MATVLIQKRKRQNRFSYIIYFKDPASGKRKYYKTFQKQKEAQQSANDLRVLLDSGKQPDRKKNRISMLTFSEVADFLKKEWITQLKTKALRQKTVDDYIITLNTVEKTFGSKLLCELSRKEVEDYRAEVASNLSNVSANKRFFVIRKIFKQGQALNAIQENPVKDIKLLSEKEHERNRFILPPDLDKLVEASRQTKGKYYMPSLIYLGAEHGASKQEALSLLWSDIDFDFEGKGFIRFYRTKNRRERTEYLMPRVKESLLAWKDHQQWMRRKKRIDPDDATIVFSHLNGTPIKSFNKAWWSSCRIAGIEDFHFHDLRHTFCSNLILSGAGLKEVKEMIGHSDISMTDRYSHLTLDHKFSKQQQLAEYYGNTQVGNT